MNRKHLNTDRWKESDRRLFVYGKPQGDTKNTPEGVMYRYIGETVMGEDFLNPYFPHDEWREGLKLESFKLYHIPWEELALKRFEIYGKPFRFTENAFNGQERYLPYIKEGLKRYYAGAIIGESHPLWNRWHQYVYIQQPPTKWTWGLGSAFHIDSRGIQWYMPIPLPSEMDLIVPDLKTNLEADIFQGPNPETG
ncbi:MAG: Athe_2463 domain-containing protein [Bacillota bacterium]